MDAERGSSGSLLVFPRQSTKRNYSATIGGHSSDLATSSRSSSSDEHYNNQHPAQRPRLNFGPDFEPSRAARFVGDGMDYRRPILSGGASAAESQNNSVIDLTDNDDFPSTANQPSVTRSESVTAAPSRATRLPRYGRDIIHIGSEDEDEDDDETIPEPRQLNTMSYGLDRQSRPYPQPSIQRNTARTSSQVDEVQFVGEQPAPRIPIHGVTSSFAAPPPRSVTPYPPAIDLTNDNDDDVVLMDARQRQGVNSNPMNTSHSTRTRSIAETLGAARDLLEAHPSTRLMQRITGSLGFGYNMQWHHPPPGPPPPPYHHHHNYDEANQQRWDNRHPPGTDPVRFARPRWGPPPDFRLVGLDYEAVGFDLGHYGGTRQQTTPKYSPPPPAAPGFTRNPAEDEVVVCPNCGNELGMGNSEDKQQVWVIKACGHAYCGECANRRTKRGTRNTRKGKGRAVDAAEATFKKCVVEGCNKSAADKAMVHVYLGS